MQRRNVCANTGTSGVVTPATGENATSGEELPKKRHEAQVIDVNEYSSESSVERAKHQ